MPIGSPSAEAPKGSEIAGACDIVSGVKTTQEISRAKSSLKETVGLTIT